MRCPQARARSRRPRTPWRRDHWGRRLLPSGEPPARYRPARTPRTDRATSAHRRPWSAAAHPRRRQRPAGIEHGVALISRLAPQARLVDEIVEQDRGIDPPDDSLGRGPDEGTTDGPDHGVVRDQIGVTDTVVKTPDDDPPVGGAYMEQGTARARSAHPPDERRRWTGSSGRSPPVASNSDPTAAQSVALVPSTRASTSRSEAGPNRRAPRNHACPHRPDPGAAARERPRPRFGLLPPRLGPAMAERERGDETPTMGRLGADLARLAEPRSRASTRREAMFQSRRSRGAGCRRRRQLVQGRPRTPRSAPTAMRRREEARTPGLVLGGPVPAGHEAAVADDLPRVLEARR